jgi:CRP/FNR family cyclic AMP-dependent transcriptional regulator
LLLFFEHCTIVPDRFETKPRIQAMPENPYLKKVTRVYRQSEVIFAEGSFGDEMYIVHSGSVHLLKDSAQGETLLGTIKPGEFFGEMALVDNAPRSVSAVAAVDQTRLLALNRDKFLFLISHQPAFALNVMHILCQRLREMNERLSQAGQLPLRPGPGDETNRKPAAD